MADKKKLNQVSIYLPDASYDRWERTKHGQGWTDKVLALLGLASLETLNDAERRGLIPLISRHADAKDEDTRNETWAAVEKWAEATRFARQSVLEATQKTPKPKRGRGRKGTG